MVDAFAQFLHTGQVDQLSGDFPAEVSGSVQTCAHCGAADGQFAEAGKCGFNTLNTSLDLAGVAAEFLAKGDRYGIHEVGAAGLDHVFPFLGLLGQGFLQHLQTRDEVFHGGLGGCHVGCGGEGVVGGLSHVDVIVGVNLNAVLGGDGGDNLVGVHVG